MKKKIRTYITGASFVAAMMAAPPAYGELDVIIVADDSEPPAQIAHIGFYEEILTENTDWNVTVSWDEFLTTDLSDYQVDLLNSYDLVILARRALSAGTIFDGEGDSTWNELTTALVVNNQFLGNVGNLDMFWGNGAINMWMNNSDGGGWLTHAYTGEVESDHPILEDLELDENGMTQVFDIQYALDTYDNVNATGTTVRLSDVPWDHFTAEFNLRTVEGEPTEGEFGQPDGQEIGPRSFLVVWDGTEEYLYDRGNADDNPGVVSGPRVWYPMGTAAAGPRYMGPNGIQLMVNAYEYAASFGETVPRPDPPEFEFYSTDFEAPDFEEGDLIGQNRWTVGETGDDGFANIVLAGQNDYPESPSGGEHLAETFAWEGPAMSTRRSLDVPGGATSVWAAFSMEVVAAYDREEPEQRFEVNRGAGGGVGFGFLGTDIVYESDEGTQVLAEGATELNTFYRFHADIRPGPSEPWDALDSSGHFDLRVYDMDDELIAEVEDVKASPFEDAPEGEGYAYFYIQDFENPNNAATLTDSISFEGVPVEMQTFAEWRSEFFGGDAENDEISGPLADPDGDGLENLLEYFLGSDPTVASREQLPVPVPMDIEVDGETGTYLTIEFTHREESEAAYSVVGGEDLNDLSTPAILESEASSEGMTTKRYRDTEPMANFDRRFLTVKVELAD